MPTVREVNPTGLTEFIGTCPHCGKYTYRSRSGAKKVAKKRHPDGHMQAYRCPEGWNNGWHIGHAHHAQIALGIIPAQRRVQSRESRGKGRDRNVEPPETTTLPQPQSDSIEGTHSEDAWPK